MHEVLYIYPKYIHKLSITAQLYWDGDIGLGEDTCVVSFASIHLSVCMYSDQ